MWQIKKPWTLTLNLAGPSTRRIPAVSLALHLTTRCRSLHRRMSRSFWSGRFGCAVAPVVAMPETDLEMMAILSWAAERVGLKWRPPPCPEPQRLDDWSLGVACAGSQHTAPGASLPKVHGELTGCGRHLLLPETNLLTPPSPPSMVVQLGSIRGSPRWSGRLRCSCVLISSPAWQDKPCLLFRACRYSSGLSGDAYVACGNAASTLHYGVTTGSSG